jgi:molybdate-binding protein/DNA-binding XRE family transcriptional regulator
MGERHRAEPAENIENRLRRLRTERQLSQGELAGMAGVTRQAIYAIEANKYLPTTAVALRLATALNCRVEDLFSLIAPGEVIEGQLIGAESISPRTRVKVARVGARYVVRPVSGLGEVLNFTVAADGLMRGMDRKAAGRKSDSVKVDLLRDRRSVDDELVVGGCDPAISLAGEYFRHRDRRGSVIGWTMGSVAALEALKREEVHVAGLHIVDAKSGESNLPYVRRHMKGQALTIVTFAAWEQGLMVRAGNPKGIRSVADLARKDVTLINREPGAGARLLLDQRLETAGVASTQVNGYQRLAHSHLEVGRLIAEGVADLGMGVRSAANLLGLEFIPLQEERYDLVIPTKYLKVHPGLILFLDTLVSRPFRREMEAMGGYDTRETGRVQSL